MLFWIKFYRVHRLQSINQSVCSFSNSDAIMQYQKRTRHTRLRQALTVALVQKIYTPNLKYTCHKRQCSNFSDKLLSSSRSASCLVARKRVGQSGIWVTEWLLFRASDTRSRNRRHKFDARFRRHCGCTTSYVIDCLRAPKAVNDVRSRASARKTGARIWHRIYGDGFWSVCQGPNDCVTVSHAAQSVCKTVHRLTTSGHSLRVNKLCVEPRQCTMQHVGCRSIFYLTETLVRHIFHTPHRCCVCINYGLWVSLCSFTKLIAVAKKPSSSHLCSYSFV